MTSETDNIRTIGRSVPVSYVIYVDNLTIPRTIKSVDCTAGAVIYSGTDAKIVIENTVGEMTYGQTLFIKSGTYLPSDVINISKAINIVGEGIISSDVWQGTRISRNGKVMNITIAGNMTNSTIKNIGFDGGDKTGSVLTLRGFHGNLSNIVVTGGNVGLDIQNSWSTTYYNIVAQDNNIGCQLGIPGVSNSNFFGCRFYTNVDTGMLVLGGQQIAFYGCTFESNGKYGICIEGYETIMLDGCYFELHPNYNLGTTAGGHIKIGTIIGGPNVVKISSCSLGKLDTHANITGADRILITNGNNIVVDSCAFYQNPGENVGTDINNNQGPDINMLLINCRLHHDGNWVIKGPVGIETISTNGLLTENFGTSVGMSMQQVIPHGLIATPSVVFLSNKDNGANPYQGAPPDMTNIYIIAVAGKKYVWNAKV